MRKKIGILGGTFDPFHKGHYMLAETAYRQFSLDEIWIMPNGNPPHKKEIRQTDIESRCEMIRLATREASYMKLCEEERSDQSYHYTYQTLEKFREIYKDYEFFFIIGADSLRDFPTWREPEKIAALCTLLVACRDDSGMKEIREQIKKIRDVFGADCQVLNSPKIDAASKEIRSMILDGEDVSNYLDRHVLDYIRSQKLYCR